MRTIWKYEYKRDGTVMVGGIWRLDIPVGWEFRHIDGMGFGLWIWLEVEETNYVEPVEFELVGTGQPVPVRSRYLGTVVWNNGLVWHLHQLNAQKPQSGIYDPNDPS